jgi:hypothetical protein
LRRPVDPLFAFPLQSRGGPYIWGNYVAKLGASFGSIVSELPTNHEEYHKTPVREWAWRLFTKGIDRDSARAQIELKGNRELGDVVL